MSNTIKLKRGSGSDPTASDLAVGEVALRTDNASLFTKKDDGNVAEIGAAAGVSDGDKGDITVSNGGSTFTIDSGVISTAKIADNAVDLTKIQDIATGHLLGRASSGTGNPQQVSAANVRTIINVEDGATADQTASEIVALIASQTIAPSALSNGVTATTQSASDNSTKVATTAYTDTAIANLVDSAPGTLNTLNELAAALGDDANFSTTVTNSIATKMPLAGGTFSGDVSFGDNKITNVHSIALDSIKGDADDNTSINFAGSDTINIKPAGTTRLAINTTGISVTGTVETTNHIQITNATPSLYLTDSNDNPDYVLRNNGGAFIIRDDTNGATRLTVNTNGHIDIHDNLDCLSGVDVTGNITVSGTVDGRDVASDGSKLDGIESGATADQSASEILTLIKTVDGSGSGLDADTVDGVNSGSFLRGDVDDTTVGHLTFARSNDAKFSLQGSNNPFFNLKEGTTEKARIQWSESGYLWIQNHEDNSVIILRDNLGFSPDAGSTIHSIFHAGNDGAGSGLDADLLDGVQGSNYVRTNQNTTITSDLFIGGGSGGMTVNGGSDIRFVNGDWTGNTTAPKIQGHDNALYITGGTNGIRFRENNADRWFINGSGHFVPSNDSTYDIGTSSIRVLNGYFDNLYGSGANITNVNATTLDSIDSGSFLRSDTDDTFSAVLTLSSTSRDCINLSGGASDDNRGIAFNGRIALSADQNDGYLRLNNASEFSNGVYTPGVIRADNGFSVDGTTIINGSGNIAYSRLTGTPTIPTNNNQLTNGAGYITSASFSDIAGGGTFTSDVAVSGGAGALTVNANSDISFSNGNWTGNHTKIQHHNSILYIVGGNSGIIFRESGTNRAQIDGNGHFVPGANNTYTLGSPSVRWQDVYTNDLNLSNEGGSNKVDNTWGDYTIQEGADDLFIINNRNGKMFKFMLQEVK